MAESKVERQLKELERLARDWRELSKQYNGWNTEEYPGYPGIVRCYFANDLEHTSVDFRLGIDREVGFGFFNPVHIELQTTEAGRLQEYIDTFTVLLAKVRQEYDQIEEQEIKAQKKAKIETLKRELGELETN